VADIQRDCTLETLVERSDLDNDVGLYRSDLNGRSCIVDHVIMLTTIRALLSLQSAYAVPPNDSRLSAYYVCLSVTIIIILFALQYGRLMPYYDGAKVCQIEPFLYV